MERSSTYSMRFTPLSKRTPVHKSPKVIFFARRLSEQHAIDIPEKT
jgi:hypothetical protein